MRDFYRAWRAYRMARKFFASIEPEPDTTIPGEPPIPPLPDPDAPPPEGPATDPSSIPSV